MEHNIQFFQLDETTFSENKTKNNPPTHSLQAQTMEILLAETLSQIPDFFSRGLSCSTGFPPLFRAQLNCKPAPDSRLQPSSSPSSSLRPTFPPTREAPPPRFRNPTPSLLPSLSSLPAPMAAFDWLNWLCRDKDAAQSYFYWLKCSRASCDWPIEGDSKCDCAPGVCGRRFVA